MKLKLLISLGQDGRYSDITLNVRAKGVGIGFYDV